MPGPESRPFIRQPLIRKPISSDRGISSCGGSCKLYEKVKVAVC